MDKERLLTLAGLPVIVSCEVPEAMHSRRKHHHALTRAAEPRLVRRSMEMSSDPYLDGGVCSH